LSLISGYRNDLLALNPAPISTNSCLASHAKITQEIKNIIGFHGRIQPFDNLLVHLFGGRERATAVADDIRVSEVEVGGEPSVWHSLKLTRMSTFHLCPLGMDNQNNWTDAIET
jgi:hypothetical protein